MSQQREDSSQDRCSVVSNPYREGKWLPQEHSAFLQANGLHKGKWNMISHFIQTRTPSQVRSHAQKYYNKKHNDENKIGYQPYKPGSNDHMVSTRLNRRNEANFSQTQQGERERELPTPIQIPKPIRKSQKNKEGSSQSRKNSKQSTENQAAKQSEQAVESQISENSFFMERIFPKMGTCLLKEFSVFTLINGGIFEVEGWPKSPYQ